MDDVARRQAKAGRQLDRVAGLGTGQPLGPRALARVPAARWMAPVDSPPPDKPAVRGVDDGVDVQRRDVGDDDLERRHCPTRRYMLPNGERPSSDDDQVLPVIDDVDDPHDRRYGDAKNSAADASFIDARSVAARWPARGSVHGVARHRLVEGVGADAEPAGASSTR